jgi:hypothetical protein
MSKWGIGLLLSILLLASPVANASSKWTLDTQSDPLKDQSISMASTSYNEGASSLGLFVRCGGNKLDAVVHFDEFLEHEDNVTVRYRIDKQALVETKWTPSATGDAVFAPDALNLAYSIMNGTSAFIIEAVDFRGQPYRASFTLVGAKDKIGKVISKCGYSLAPLDTTVPGLRHEIALELENWGPKHILAAKKLLSGEQAYSGSQDPKMDNDFALAIQKYYDGYMASCKNGDESDINCKVYREAVEAGESPDAPSVETVLYEKATGDLKDEINALKFRE